MNKEECKNYCRTLVSVANVTCDEQIIALGLLRKNILDKRIKYILLF